MSNYTQITSFTPKDSLLTGNPAKKILGAQLDPEFAAIATAIATKYDSSNIGSSPVLFADGAANLPSVAFASATGTGLYKAAANSLGFAANGVAAGSISSAGAWSIPAPSSGNIAVSVTGVNSSYAQVITAGGTGGSSFGLKISCGDGNHNADTALSVQFSGNETFSCRTDGQNYTYIPNAYTNPPANMAQVGYVDTPANGQSGAYQLIMSDRGKSIQHQSASAHTWTIPANGTTAFPVGTTIVLVNDPAGGVITLNITTDTLRWMPTNSTGSRSLAAGAVATLYKYSTTTWFITGVGIS